MGYNNQTTEYVSSGKYAAVAAWAASHTYAAGSVVRQSATPSVGHERCWFAMVGGTSGSTEPTWTFSRGDKVTDSAVTWIECTGQAAINGDFTNSPSWSQASGAVSQGHVIVDGSRTHAFICSVAGSTGGSEPSFDTSSIGATTTDSGATWVYMGTTGTITKWGAPHALQANASTGDWGSSIVQVFFGNSHTETTSGFLNISFGGGGTTSVDLICVNESGNVPPQSSDITTGATLKVAPDNFIVFTNALRAWGLSAILDGNVNGSITTFDSADKEFNNCSFDLGTNGAAAFGLMGSSGRTLFNNCTLNFGNTTQTIQTSGYGQWIGGAMTGTALTSLFQDFNQGSNLIKGVDLTSLIATGGYILQSASGNGGEEIRFEDCKPPSVGFQVGFTAGIPASTRVLASRCGADYQFFYGSNKGTISSDASVVHSLGASDSGTLFSWTFRPDSTYVDWGNMRLQSPPIAQWNSVIGSTVTLTCYGIANDSALPTNKDVWIEADYLGTSGSTQSSHASSRVADPAATPSSYSADTTSAWDSAASARVDSNAYAAGDAIKTASNSGRVFYCQTAGTSASSEPGGYASAVDGGSVTDGGAVFRAGYRFKITLALSSPAPQVAGNINARINVGKPSTTYSFDPLITFS